MAEAGNNRRGSLAPARRTSSLPDPVQQGLHGLAASLHPQVP